MHYRETRRVAIVDSRRIPFCRAHTAYARASNQAMMTAVLEALVDACGLAGERIGDVALGAVMKHASDWNLARECVLGSRLAPETPAFDLQRACGTSLEAAILLGNKIALGQIDSAIAGGTDTVSDLPVAYDDEYRELLMSVHRARSTADRLKPWLKLRPKHLKPVLPGVVEPRTGLSMGQSTEQTARTWGITREDQDQLALASHQRAAQAWSEGFYADLVVPWSGATIDNNIRPDTSLERLGRLKPVFAADAGATMTAGNSTPLTDGAAAVLLASEEWAREHDLPVQAWLRYGKVAAVDFVHGEEGLLMAPAYAVSDMLRDAGLGLGDFDLYEIHEAFAAQTLATLKAWESPEFCRERLGRDRPLGPVDRSRMNPKGGSIAIGHPFAATGARILGSIAKQLAQKGGGRGLVSICTAGGMGVTAIVER